MESKTNNEKKYQKAAGSCCFTRYSLNKFEGYLSRVHSKPQPKLSIGALCVACFGRDAADACRVQPCTPH